MNKLIYWQDQFQIILLKQYLQLFLLFLDLAKNVYRAHRDGDRDHHVLRVHHDRHVRQRVLHDRRDHRVRHVHHVRRVRRVSRVRRVHHVRHVRHDHRVHQHDLRVHHGHRDHRDDHQIHFFL